jgi:hypothetical protein
VDYLKLSLRRCPPYFQCVREIPWWTLIHGFRHMWSGR